jgi:DNA (cytosine-5)-methyltransferase 1
MLIGCQMVKPPHLVVSSLAMPNSSYMAPDLLVGAIPIQGVSSGSDMTLQLFPLESFQGQPGQLSLASGPEHFVAHNGLVTRTLHLRDGRSKSMTLPIPFDLTDCDASAQFDAAWLRQRIRPAHEAGGPTVVVVDLFAGCGGLSLGVVEACSSLGYRVQTRLAIDSDPAALDVFGLNFPGTSVVAEPIEDLLDGELGSPWTAREHDLKESVGQVDLLVGGPPCQGNSDLNNHSRRTDPKNRLYERMARFAEVVEPTHIIIENVPAVVHDRGSVVNRTWSALRRLGYFVDGAVVRADELGVPQRRKRFLTVASRQRSVSINALIKAFHRPRRPLSWGIGDLAELDAQTTYDSSARHSQDNLRRIDYLFEHDIYDLPNDHRPDCHRLKKHSYGSVYGRLRWDEAAPTITCGFGSTGQGRFVHPSRRRTLTPHEAARLQFFPDYFQFGNTPRRKLQTLIGNAVPSKLAYVVAVDLLR